MNWSKELKENNQRMSNLLASNNLLACIYEHGTTHYEDWRKTLSTKALRQEYNCNTCRSAAKVLGGIWCMFTDGSVLNLLYPENIQLPTRTALFSMWSPPNFGGVTIGIKEQRVTHKGKHKIFRHIHLDTNIPAGTAKFTHRHTYYQYCELGAIIVNAMDSVSLNTLIEVRNILTRRGRTKLNGTLDLLQKAHEQRFRGPDVFKHVFPDVFKHVFYGLISGDGAHGWGTNGACRALCKDLSYPIDENIVCKRYDTLMNPVTYQRPTAPASVQHVEKTIKDLDALGYPHIFKREIMPLSRLPINDALYVHPKHPWVRQETDPYVAVMSGTSEVLQTMLNASAQAARSIPIHKGSISISRLLELYGRHNMEIHLPAISNKWVVYTDSSVPDAKSPYKSGLLQSYFAFIYPVEKRTVWCDALTSVAAVHSIHVIDKKPVFVFDGARLRESPPQVDLFPEVLVSELKPYARVIEQGSQRVRHKVLPGAHAIGLGATEKHPVSVLVHVNKQSPMLEYLVFPDR